MGIAMRDGLAGKTTSITAAALGVDVLDNVVVTPHCASLSAEAVARMAVVSVRNLLAGLEGTLEERLMVNKESCDNMRCRVEYSGAAVSTQPPFRTSRDVLDSPAPGDLGRRGVDGIWVYELKVCFWALKGQFEASARTAAHDQIQILGLDVLSPARS